MHVITFCTLAVVLGYHVVVCCPSGHELTQEVQRCVTEMMTFVDYKGDKREKCPNLKEGSDCIDDLLESCKEKEGLKGETYDFMKKRLTKSRQDYDKVCGHTYQYLSGDNGVGVARFSVLVMVSAYLAYLVTRL